MDELLEVRWCDRQARWQVMRRRVGGEVPSGLVKRDVTERDWWKYVPVYRVENDDGSYRELDRRTVVALRKADRLNAEADDDIRRMERRERLAEKRAENRLEPQRKDMAEYLRRVAVGNVMSGYGGTAIQQARSQPQAATEVVFDGSPAHEVSGTPV